jgi:hypothetical protein
VSDDTILHELFATFAEHLIPEAFGAPTRAYRVTLDDLGLTSTADEPGGARFDRWVAARIDDALAAAWPHDWPLAVAFTSDGQLLRRYDEPGCGHVRCVAAVVRDEVAAIATPWLFGAALPRPQPYWEVLQDDDGNELDEVLRPAPITTWTATWYAEARGRGVAATAAGTVELHGERIVGGSPLHVRTTDATRTFNDVLLGHPARRRHQVRRRSPRSRW